MAKGSAAFEGELCKGCGLCVNACPQHALEMDQTVINRKGYHPAHFIAGREHECIGCAMCAVMCPDQGIEVEKFDRVTPSDAEAKG
ncbi:4Fe-4S dicluster domain-containing protein [Propioniciclava tarda]|mgnify:CR=1 FL=1|uniref:4Fe-4S dicluster domain-containing protein n=1 Tax=Propioniciclava tarda TaxID=433330 RepID=A0A4Q9KM53_PROTD|nr:4Fe-4S dicluster domain-containing protein [Propioniciclava tarda]TBT94809.1 4Fe-4S dicluster domain-containing protein [Propioniciclava tarda]SMO63027.1 2-oxoglutarate ferredoxin oxidoreductase subunit delta [Propioniciclava tarda]HOA89835.1 4Fe-4S dicluster domain-containing protein [Propioniciclava tarda]HQA31938.1 4Fe-4S dicluster domain-containing protein [Propioniciclava tarda]HQD61650.1 4Fe-4S dicluster domain-containing protein [Propioniciclava tarda]